MRQASGHGGPDGETTVAPPQAGREAGRGTPTGARYRSALDPLLPAALPAVAPRRDAVAAARTAVTTPSAPVGLVAGTVMRGAVTAPRGAGAPQAPRRQPAADGPAADRVPAGLASAFFAVHGTDVSDVPVRRGRTVSRQATQIDAAAFSHGGAVYVPDSAGALDQPQAQALLAHELTHAVQQRMLGAALPDEASPQGRELEEQAVATQRWFLGAAGPVPALGPLTSRTPAQLTHAPAAQHVSRTAAEETAGTTLAAWGSGAAVAAGVQRQPAAAAPDLVAPTAPNGAAAPQEAPAASGQGAAAHPDIADLKDQVAGLAGQRSPDLDDSGDLDELAAKLYRRLRSKLRLELIVDRERAGLLTDFR